MRAPFVDFSKMAELAARNTGMDSASIHSALAVHGVQDRLVPIQDAKSELAGKGLEIAVTEGVGHRSLLEDEGVLDKVRGHIAL